MLTPALVCSKLASPTPTVSHLSTRPRLLRERRLTRVRFVSAVSALYWIQYPSHEYNFYY